MFPLNLILIYNLHATMNPPTLPASPLKMAGLATSIWDPMLDPVAAPPVPTCNDLKLELRLQLRQRFEKLREVDSSGKA